MSPATWPPVDYEELFWRPALDAQTGLVARRALDEQTGPYLAAVTQGLLVALASVSHGFSRNCAKAQSG